MKTIFKKSKVNKGFSLLEVLLAVVLLAIVITPLIGTIYTSLSLNRNSKKLMAATDLAQDMVEYYESMTSEEIITTMNAYGNGSVIDPLDYVNSRSITMPSNVGLAGFAYFETYAMTSAHTAKTNGDPDNNLYKCIVTADTTMYAITSVYYEGYPYDVFVEITPNSAFNDTDEYIIYDIKVDVFEINTNKSGFDSVSGRNVFDPVALASYTGSTFNKID